jgi:hypothetical protein
MNTGQVMLSIAAFMFLGTVLVNFNHLVLANNEDMSDSHDLIIATTIASTYLDAAQSMNYDENSIEDPIYDPSGFTDPNSLGPDGEVDISGFDDFDDFNEYSVTEQAEGNNGIFRSDFTVSYVDPEDINYRSVQTYLKRLDIKTWRVDVAATRDTVRMFTTMAYFKFN